MPVLAYCMLDSSISIQPPTTGVAGAPVNSIIEFGVQCFFSPLKTADFNSESSAKEAALEFHRVLRTLFDTAAIIPFRFPTIVRGKEELSQYLREHAQEHQNALYRLRDLVQMEVRITESAGSDVQPSITGGEYLRLRQESVKRLQASADSLRTAIQPLLRDWRQRPRTDGIHSYALIPRTAIAEFEQRLRSIQLATGFTVRITGPWPATQFLTSPHA